MALCQPVPGRLTADPTGTLLSSYLAEPTSTAPNPPSITNTPNNVAAAPLCAVSFDTIVYRGPIDSGITATLRVFRRGDGQLQQHQRFDMYMQKSDFPISCWQLRRS